MSRAPGWEERLLAVAEDWRNRPFAWGRADCLCFARAAVEAVQGGPVDWPSPSYRNAREASRALRQAGAAVLSEAFAARYDELPVAMAQRGDLGVVIEDGRECAVVNYGPQWLGMAETGLSRVPGHRVTRAFRV